MSNHRQTNPKSQFQFVQSLNLTRSSSLSGFAHVLLFAGVEIVASDGIGSTRSRKSVWI